MEAYGHFKPTRPPCSWGRRVYGQYTLFLRLIPSLVRADNFNGHLVGGMGGGGGGGSGAFCSTGSPPNPALLCHVHNAPPAP